MTWKNLWMEFYKNLALMWTGNQENQKFRDRIAITFMGTANIINIISESYFEERLNEGSKIASYLRTHRTPKVKTFPTKEFLILGFYIVIRTRSLFLN